MTNVNMQNVSAQMVNFTTKSGKLAPKAMLARGGMVDSNPGIKAFLDEINDAGLMRRPGALPFMQTVLHFAGAQLEDITGPKTRNFTRNNDGDLEYVTVDSHAIMALVGWYDTAGSWQFSERIFHNAATMYRDFAHSKGIAPADMQAIVWIARKAILDDQDFTVESDGPEYVRSRYGGKSSNGYNLTVKAFEQYANVSNLEIAWQYAVDNNMVEDGSQWYRLAYAEIGIAAKDLGVSHYDLAVVVALLSPGRDWISKNGRSNILDAVDTIKIAQKYGIV